MSMDKIYTIENDRLRVSVSVHGAELTSIIRKADDTEMLWQADERWWKRHSPALFPIVGSLWQGTAVIEGEEYHMGQHGFARDSDFTLVEAQPQSITFALNDTDITRSMYPYHFRLEISYELHDATIEVKWRVRNTDTRPIHFQIGAHPAFLLPSYNPANKVQGYIRFDDPRTSYPLSVVGQLGCVTGQIRETPLGPEAAITPRLFDVATIIVENVPMRSVTLLDLERRPYLRLTHDAPVIGIWAPVKNGTVAPFVCIEPWYGRCDTMEYEGDFAKRPWTNTLSPGEDFDARYAIDILSN